MYVWNEMTRCFCLFDHWFGSRKNDITSRWNFWGKKRQQWHMRWFYEISFTSTHWLKKMWVEIQNLGWSRKHSAKIERANRALCQQILCAREQNREHRAPGHALKKGLVIANSKIVSLLIYPTALCKLGPQNRFSKTQKMNDFW